MGRLLQFTLNDLRNIFREQMLWVIFIVAPILQFLIARFAVPEVEVRFPILKDYHLIILMLLTLQIVTGLGFVLASVLLDEKDENVLTAIRVLPLPPETYLSYRLISGTGVAFIFSWTMLTASGLLKLSLFASFAGALLFALLTPIVVLILATFASNKVEGLAIFKGLNLILLLPVASTFLPDLFNYLLAIVPVYWTMQFLQQSLNGQGVFQFFAIAILLHFIFIAVLFYFFRRKVF